MLLLPGGWTESRACQEDEPNVGHTACDVRVVTTLFVRRSAFGVSARHTLRPCPPFRLHLHTSDLPDLRQLDMHRHHRNAPEPAKKTNEQRNRDGIYE